MKLLELLVKERIEWHPEALCYTQDEAGYCGPFKIDSPSMQTNGQWSSRGMIIGASVPGLPVADDWQTAIVTKEQYDNACKLVDDGYTLWFGGECPVHPENIVDIVWIHNCAAGELNNVKAVDFPWNQPADLIAYKVVAVMPKNVNCRCDSVPVATEYPAHSFLEKGVQHMKDRAAQRDSAEGERSMAACVNAFNAMFGKDLTETQGWQFMVLLKMARSRNKFNPDDYEDGAAYTGLAGEAHSHE